MSHILMDSWFFRPVPGQKLLAVLWVLAILRAAASACEIPDNGTGTADLPPQNCDYLSPADVHMIIDGLPPDTTIRVGARHFEFFGITRTPGGMLGGEVEQFQSILALDLQGTGGLAAFHRQLTLPAQCETHVGPRTPGDPVQSFFAEMFGIQGQIVGDPDFDLLRVTAGSGFGLPSPGITTLTKTGSNWTVDSFFDITYRIDFVGAPGGSLLGMSGSTTGTIRMATGSSKFIRGDSNADGATDISDAVAILNYLFLGKKNVPCDQTGDVNDDGALDISDGIYILNFLFLGGMAIEPPVGNCGLDPTGHGLPCASFSGCN